MLKIMAGPALSFEHTHKQSFGCTAILINFAVTSIQILPTSVSVCLITDGNKKE